MREDFEEVNQARTTATEKSSAMKEAVQVQVNALNVESAELLAKLNQRLPAVPKVASRQWLYRLPSHASGFVVVTVIYRAGVQPSVRCVGTLSWRQPSKLRVSQQLAAAKRPLCEKSSHTENVAVAEVKVTPMLDPIIEGLEKRLKKELKTKQRLQDDRFQMKLELHNLRDKLTCKCDQVAIVKTDPGHVRQQHEELTQQQVINEENQPESETSIPTVELPVVQTCEPMHGPLPLSPVEPVLGLWINHGGSIL